MPSLAKKSGPTCEWTFWKVPLGGDKSLDLLCLHATSILQHASAVHFGTKRRQAPAFIAHYKPDGARELAQLCCCAAEAQTNK